MAIRLHVNNTTFSGTVRLSAESPISIAYNPDTHTITLTRSIDSLLEKAFDWFISYYSAPNNRYISKINGVQAAVNGVFYILGSACDSVTPAKNATDSNVEPRNDIHLSDLDSDSREHALAITDLCPACSKCDTQYQIKRYLEFYNIYFNLIKDINLYAINVINARHLDLKNNRIEIQEGCRISALTQEEEDEEYNKLLNRAEYLLQNYITTLHMWNYAVSVNNNDTRVSTPPEDSSGVLVQTKRALSDCSGDRGLRCTISLEPTPNLPNAIQDDLSIFVPSPSVTFEPFEYSPASTIQVNHIDYTSKSIVVTFTSLSTAGTCIVTAKFLPFIYTIMTTGASSGTSGGVTGDADIITFFEGLSSGAQLSSGGLFYNTSGGESSESTPSADNAVLDTGITMTQSRLQAPTAAEYEHGKSYPSKTEEGYNSWFVQVKWDVLKDGEVEQTRTETYNFTTPKCRVPMPGVTKNSEFIDIIEEDITNPETTE